MNQTEDICGCVMCTLICGVCFVAAAENDKSERERTAAEAAERAQSKSPVVRVSPVPVVVVSPRAAKAEQAAADAPDELKTKQQ